MNNTICATLFSKENITLFIAIVGFAGTIISWIASFLRHRRNISVQIIDYAQRLHVIQLFIRIQNNSSAPLAIHSVSISGHDDTFSCELIPKRIREFDSDPTKSPMFPINLVAKQGYQCFLEFLYCEDIELAPGKTIGLIIHSNRGPINKSVTLGNTSHYLHIVYPNKQSQS